MVVTRRTPVIPQQPLARNQAAQRPPRTSHLQDASGASNNASGVAAASFAGPSNGNSGHSNGLDDTPGRKSRRSKKHSKRKRQKSNFQAFLDFLTKLLLIAFTIYTFSVCPQDTNLQSPLCRGLAEYKRLVLDPYIIPPIQAAFTHPSIAPYIERTKPYVHRAVEITTPILLRTQQEWNLHVVPQWENRIVPEWNKYVVPHWDKHIAPSIQRIQSTLEPYRLRAAQRYEQRILPHVQLAYYNLQRWQRQVDPYIVLAVSKTRDGYHAAKPYAVPIVKKSGHLLQRFALFLREQRQEFVDPHVAKIWEKVKELSRGKQIISESGPEPESPTPTSDVSVTILETVGYEATASSADFHTSVYDGVHTSQETDVAHTASSLSTSETTEVAHFPQHTATPVVEPAHPTGTPTELDAFLNAQAVLTESLNESEPPTSDESTSVMEPVSTATSIFVADTTTSSSSSSLPPADEPTSSTASAALPQITMAAAKATVPPANTRADDEIDFDAFYAELGLDEPLGNPGSSSQESNTGPPNPPAETEEEIAERVRLKAEETARKRADIEARQTKWEMELGAQMERSTSQLQIRLANLRAAAAAELALSTEVRSAIEELFGEAEKYIKGAEIYLKNLKGESRRSDEKLALWDRVADRVNDKFAERLLSTQGTIHVWYKIILDKELEEVSTVAAEVREVAEKGQLDLGLDYAWLEDVTYDDWQRYHALIGTSEQFAHEAASIQNGTHPTVVVTNPLSPTFQDLESEVHDVVIGFETRLRRIKREGERAFNNHGNGVAQKEEGKGSVEAEPEVSIQPIPSGDVGFVPPIAIGRSKKEVLEALGRAEPVSEAQVPIGGSHVDPEEVISRLAREVEGGAETVHTEL